MATRPLDPLRSFTFRVWFDGEEQGGFSSVSGLRRETEIIEYREGNEASTPRKVPGLTKFDNITLERGVIGGFFREWLEEIFSLPKGLLQAPNNNFRKTITIEVLNKNGSTARTFRVYHCWPTVVEHSDLTADSSELFMEKIEIAHEGWEVVDSPPAIF